MPDTLGPTAAIDAGAPTLTQRRKATTQLEIARAAARLFTEQGAQGTTADSIASASGVSLRTFYRYFRTKEESVAPLLSVGADAWRTLLASAPVGTPLHDAVERGIVVTLETALAGEEFAWTRGLLRAAVDDDALADVWYRVNRESEERLAPVLAALAPASDPLRLRLVAAAATDAIRIALETWARAESPTESPSDLAVRCFRALSGC